jgi:tetratricopeptide (TPR) repeat protein
MMRLIALAAVFGALIAAGPWHATSSSTRISTVDAAPHTAVAATAADDAWPICTTMTALGTESDWAQLDPDFAAGKRALAVENWDGAIRALDLALLRDPFHADIQNYIGYAHARLRQLGPAMGHYQRALMINPRHRGARTHLGELFLTLGEPSKAQEQLVALKEICLIPCEEIDFLQRAIDAGTRRLSLPE